MFEKSYFWNDFLEGTISSDEQLFQRNDFFRGTIFWPHDFNVFPQQMSLWVLRVK
jgi:hypothetical protein